MLFFIVLGAFCSSGAISGFAGSSSRELKHVERSFTIDASLATFGTGDYAGTNFPSLIAPSETEIRNAAHLLTGEYGANRIYLVYRKEIPIADAERVFGTWRQSAPAEVEVVPTLVLRASDRQQSELFSAAEIQSLTRFFKGEINRTRLGIINWKGEPDEGASLKVLATEFKSGLCLVGLLPDGKLSSPFSGAVADIRSALCKGKSNDDWQQTGFGLDALRRAIRGRNEQSLPVAWSLVIAACDYSASGSGAEPGFDDLERKMPLASGRDTAAAREILQLAPPESFSGFNTDLHALQVSSQPLTHDGSGYSFYEMLKRGQFYVGYYARPFHEVVKIYTTLRAGHQPDVAR